jgi:hypothetical protein
VFGKALAGVVTAVAILAASVAWAGWVYLHTVADPSRSNRIAHAILDNPAARHELAVDISESLATAANKALVAHKLPATVDGADPTLEGAVDAALGDPRIAANIVDAITAEHARALGAQPAHPAVIDTGLLLTAVRAHLTPVDPQLARALPTVAPAQVKLPAVKVPFARQARQWAQRWVHVLALGALAGLLLALLIGERAAVLRRWGIWAISAAALWAVLPPLAVRAGDSWAKSQAAVIRAVVRGATGGVNTAAVMLAVGGIAAVVVSIALSRLGGFALPSVAGGSGPPAARAPAPQASSGWAPTPSAAPVPSPSPAGPPPAPARWATDTWSPQGPRTEEVPVIYDRSGRLPQQGGGVPVAGAAAGPVANAPPTPSGSAAPVEPSSASADPSPLPREVPEPPPPRARPSRRPGVSRPLLDPTAEDTTGLA